MRLKRLLLGDIRFQIKYGFYFLYTFITVIYIVVLAFIPPVAKSKVSAVIIFTDPATLGLFFMGAIILLEKSQRVLSSLAVSPIKLWEYIFSKVISLAFISTLVGAVIGVVSGTQNVLWITVGTFLGSILFSLIGIIVATKVSSLNQFLIAIVPVMLFLMLPPLAELFGYSHPAFDFHAGNIILRFINGRIESLPLMLLVLFIWIVALYFITLKSAEKMIRDVGGNKL
ncbi:MAG: ABC transporter permease [Cellulosilyticaceae bacterium]